MYQFTPDNPFRSFNRYYVLITPKTQRVYEIWGIGPAGKTEAGKKEQALVMELLQEKYGIKEKEGMFDSLRDMRRIEQGNRYILVKLTGFLDTSIEIRYCDYDLGKIAEKERLELEKKKVDGRGL